MLKIKLMLFLALSASLLIPVYSTTASVQWSMSAKDQQFYTNNPCSDPKISWALWNESAGMHKPTGGIGNYGDCDPSNYGSWSTAPQLESNLHAYRQMMSRQGVAQSVFTGRDGHAYVTVKDAGGLLFGIDAGRIVAQGAGNIVAQGAGNLVPASQIVAQGAGNIVAQGAGNVVAQGAGNFRGVMAAGDKVVQFPGKWVKLVPAQPAAAPSRPTTPMAPSAAPNTGSTPARSDDAILMCLNSTVNQIRARDNGANHVSLTVTSGTVNLTGNVLTQASKDAITNAARSCGAKMVNSNNLRVGR